MQPGTTDTIPGLLPAPRAYRTARGKFLVGPGSSVEIRVGRTDPDAASIERSLRRWLDESAHGWRGGENVMVCMAVEAGEVRHAQGYRLTINESTVRIVGGSPAGCFYGLQTLRQLSRLSPAGLPCCEIEDWPDFDTRGLLHDVTRGKVPTLDTLKELVDRLALLKVNQLQLNIEHAFVFSFDPDICLPDHGLTPDEVCELDGYCRDRFIDLVPALATFGHMGRILSMPRYRHLAEVEPRASWEKLDWLKRVRGFTLNIADPQAWALVQHMWTDVLDAFGGPIVNICGDEPWDLGAGKNRGRFTGERKGAAYLDHICRTHDFCAARGRRVQFWSDVVSRYPQLFDRVPRDATVLHWGYDDRAEYDVTAAFVGAGLDTAVCPGTSGWKRIINAIGLAERNISTFAAAGLRHGARGLVNTDWGDHGHFNMLSCSWHGIALGAACGWNAAHPTGEAFDERFARLIWGTGAEGVNLLRRASRIADACETWRLFWRPWKRIAADKSLPDDEALTQTLKAARSLARWCRDASPAGHADKRDLTEITLAAEFTELFAHKIAMIRGLELAGGVSAPERLRTAAATFADAWLARDKRSGLDDVLRALDAVAADLSKLQAGHGRRHELRQP